VKGAEPAVPFASVTVPLLAAAVDEDSERPTAESEVAPADEVAPESEVVVSPRAAKKAAKSDARAAKKAAKDDARAAKKAAKSGRRGVLVAGVALVALVPAAGYALTEFDVLSIPTAQPSETPTPTNPTSSASTSPSPTPTPTPTVNSLVYVPSSAPAILVKTPAFIPPQDTTLAAVLASIPATARANGASASIAGVYGTGAGAESFTVIAAQGVTGPLPSSDRDWVTQADRTWKQIWGPGASATTVTGTAEMPEIGGIYRCFSGVSKPGVEASMCSWVDNTEVGATRTQVLILVEGPQQVAATYLSQVLAEWQDDQPLPPTPEPSVSLSLAPTPAVTVDPSDIQ
jgi:hypothetical protein